MSIDMDQLGVILFQITQEGRLSYNARSEKEIKSKIIQGDYRFKYETNVAIVFLIHRLMWAEPNHRWNSKEAIRFINEIYENLPDKKFKDYTISNKNELPGEILQYIPKLYKLLRGK